MATVESDAGSTVPRRQLGRYLRQLREKKGLTVKAAAEVLECSFQKVWRIEKGSVPVRGTDVRFLCQAYEASLAMTEALVGLARETKSRGWWQAYGQAVPEWFELYVGLEGAASRIRKFDPIIVPGLLQARAYMEEVILADQPDMTPDEVQSRIAIKVARQGLLTRHFPPPPRIEAIIWEPVLRSPLDVPGALEQQLFHLLKTKELPHVSIRVLPLSVGSHHAAGSGAFTTLEFPSDGVEKGEPPTVYLESLTGALYLDKPNEIQRYENAWSALAARAQDEKESLDTIATILKETNSNA